jgi:hypothetical protein
MTGHGGSPLAAALRCSLRGFWRALAGFWRAFRGFWRALRTWSGDAAYESYLARAGDGERLDAKAFYLDTLRRRYRGQPDRCC